MNFYIVDASAVNPETGQTEVGVYGACASDARSARAITEARILSDGYIDAKVGKVERSGPQGSWEKGAVICYRML